MIESKLLVIVIIMLIIVIGLGIVVIILMMVIVFRSPKRKPSSATSLLISIQLEITPPLSLSGRSLSLSGYFCNSFYYTHPTAYREVDGSGTLARFHSASPARHRLSPFTAGPDTQAGQYRSEVAG